MDTYTKLQTTYKSCFIHVDSQISINAFNTWVRSLVVSDFALGNQGFPIRVQLLAM